MKTYSMNNLEFIDSYWFHHGGAVICQDTVTKEYKGYISGIKSYDRDTEEDIKQIMAFGSKMPKEHLDVYWPGIIKNETKTWQENNPEYLL